MVHTQEIPETTPPLQSMPPGLQLVSGGFHRTLLPLPNHTNNSTQTTQPTTGHLRQSTQRFTVQPQHTHHRPTHLHSFTHIRSLQYHQPSTTPPSHTTITHTRYAFTTHPRRCTRTPTGNHSTRQQMELTTHQQTTTTNSSHNINAPPNAHSQGSNTTDTHTTNTLTTLPPPYSPPHYVPTSTSHPASQPLHHHTH